MAGYRWHVISIRKKRPRSGIGAYRTPEPLYSLLGSISRPFSSTFFSRSKVDKIDAAASVRVEWTMCFPAQTLPRRSWNQTCWRREQIMLTFYQIQMRCPSGLWPNCRVLRSLKSAQAWTRVVQGSPVRCSTSPCRVRWGKFNTWTAGNSCHHWLATITEFAGIW